MNEGDDWGGIEDIEMPDDLIEETNTEDNDAANLDGGNDSGIFVPPAHGSDPIT